MCYRDALDELQEVPFEVLYQDGEQTVHRLAQFVLMGVDVLQPAGHRQRRTERVQTSHGTAFTAKTDLFDWQQFESHFEHHVCFRSSGSSVNQTASELLKADFFILTKPG